MGGVSTGRHAVELVAAGATAVALGTILFSDPDAPDRIRSEIAAELTALGFDSLEAVHGVAHAGGVALTAR
jgi:dihydroorotate dehydrogenase (NAD+) catalytic subunit